MANLIITVISIALVAVAALMGAYYGGSAFMDGQAKAQANAIVAGFEQVNTALQLYYSQTGIQDNQMTGLYELVPNYLSKIPNPGSKTAGDSNPNGQIYMFLGGAMTNAALLVYVDKEAICKQIETARTGTVTTSLSNYVGNSSATFQNKMGCVYDASNFWSTAPAHYYIAYYLPYGKVD